MISDENNTNCHANGSSWHPRTTACTDREGDVGVMVVADCVDRSFPKSGTLTARGAWTAFSCEGKSYETPLASVQDEHPL